MSLALPVDLTTCDREPIHTPGSIQPIGFLLVLSQELKLVGASANVQQFLGRDFETLKHQRLDAIFTPSVTRAITERLDLLHGPDAMERLFGFDIAGDGRCFDISVHQSGFNILVECEPSETDPDTNSGELVRTMLERLRATTGFDRFTREAARQMKLLTGFDRVMLYRFAPDGSGEVIAEAARPDLESYFGHHYPASDIPQQARILYTRNWLRIIADIGAAPVPLVSAFVGQREPLDLSMSVLRAVSPIHIEYLQNMGVQASMSISILREGKLWGLFACHHYEPRHNSFERRTAAELFGQMFSWLLEAREREMNAAYEARARALQERMVIALGADLDARSAVTQQIEDFQKTIHCDGVGVWHDGAVTTRGEALTEAEFTALVKFLNRVSPGRLFVINELGSVFADAKAYANRVAGVLAVPISRAPRDYLMFFRREVAREKTWAGDPTKSITSGPLGDRLTPRKSFEAWQQVVRGQSIPWRDADVRIAESLRTTLLEVILRLTDATAKERQAAEERQELLIAELNHRVRNILALIRGLVNQSRSTSHSVEEFASVLGGRVQALARAHDQLTQTNWGPGGLQMLVESEAGAYLGEKTSRVRLDGPDIALDPKAFSTLALVVHEMMTNSAKYGALCDSTGAVDVSWKIDEGDRLVIEWRETGGPPVQPPKRRGFGTTIIERSIPFDLNGEAEINYEMFGVRARFVLPPAYFRQRSEAERAEMLSAPPLAAGSGQLAGNVLVVEDNLIIAVNAEGILLELGAEQVVTAASVRDAMAYLDKHRPSFAVLDINLGPENSLSIAKRLVEMDVCFIFATGYGDRAVLPDALKSVPIIQKPYATESIRRAFASAEPAVA